MTSHLTNRCVRKAGHREAWRKQKGGAATTGTNIGQWEARTMEWVGKGGGASGAPVPQRRRLETRAAGMTGYRTGPGIAGTSPMAATAQSPETAPGLVLAVERRL